MLVLKFIKEVMNFSVKIQSIYSKTLLETYIKSFLRLLEGDTDIAIGGIPMWSEFNIFGDPKIWYTQAETGLYVPCARPKAVSGNILKVFTTQVWLLSIAVLLLVATLIWHHLNMGFAP
ncbi:hypothetical protein C0J52_07279 [Blattella germanica]|nr:hypothetical protein C0J52_07279 [Blattella germanica]